MAGPLQGLRVVEMAGIGPGPFAAMLLADMGADVIRIQRPDRAGDDHRFDVMGRNRRTIVLDLRKTDDVQRALALVERADVLVEVTCPRDFERWII
ncbi:MAG: CoA transferase [Betaproteobacteria bacterium]|nr:CoA transferase [Betaproteobacteria bacterium]